MTRLSKYLTYAGSLPFILCAAALVMGVMTLPILGDTHEVLAAYVLVITSFMAGAQWGQQFGADGRWPVKLALFSNAVALLVWGAFLLASFPMQMITFAVLLLSVLVMDHKLYAADIINADYYRTRRTVTGIVIAALLISGISA